MFCEEGDPFASEDSDGAESGWSEVMDDEAEALYLEEQQRHGYIRGSITGSIKVDQESEVPQEDLGNLLLQQRSEISRATEDVKRDQKYEEMHFS